MTATPACSTRLHPACTPRGIPAVMFLITDLIGTDHVLWTTEVEQLVASGGRTSLDPTCRRPCARPGAQAVPRSRPSAGDRGAPRHRDRWTAHGPTVERTGDRQARPVGHGHRESHDEPPVPATVLRMTSSIGKSPAHVKCWQISSVSHRSHSHIRTATTTPASRRAVSRAGYAVAFGFDHRLSPITTSTTRMRSPVSASTSKRPGIE